MRKSANRQDADVGRLVDDGLNKKRPPFIQVLLDPAALVAEVHLHLGAGREDLCSERLGGGRTPAVAAEYHVDIEVRVDEASPLEGWFEVLRGPMLVSAWGITVRT